MTKCASLPATMSHLAELFAHLAKRPRVAVVCPDDSHTREVVERCLNNNLADFILVSPAPSEWADNLAATHTESVVSLTADGIDGAAALAVQEVRGGRADVVMKGAINTDNLLRAILNKQCGLLPEGNILTHLTAAHIPSYHKLLFFSDAAVIPQPDEAQMRAIVTYDTAILRRLGISPIKVATIHFTEKTNEKFPHTIYYRNLIAEATEGRFGADVIISGPMDVKSACDAHSAQIKHIEGGVSGDADLLLFPNLVAANTFYKTISCFASATMAGIICGASAPIVIPSRADSADSKFYSLALACIARQ